MRGDTTILIKHVDGMLEGPDGCLYESRWEVFSMCVLGMCGCGSPEDAYNFLREILIRSDRRGALDTPPTRDWVNLQDAVRDLVVANPEIAAHCLLHFLSDKNVIEHGGSVGGSWLTKLGEQIVDDPPAV